MVYYEKLIISKKKESKLNKNAAFDTGIVLDTSVLQNLWF